MSQLWVFQTVIKSGEDPVLSLEKFNTHQDN